MHLRVISGQFIHMSFRSEVDQLFFSVQVFEEGIWECCHIQPQALYSLHQGSKQSPVGVNDDWKEFSKDSQRRLQQLTCFIKGILKRIWNTAFTHGVRKSMVEDVEILEKVQQRATKWVRSLKNKCWRKNVIETYKIITDKKILTHLNSSCHFSRWLLMYCHGLRGHQFKLYKESCHLNIRKKFPFARSSQRLKLTSFARCGGALRQLFKKRLDDLAELDNWKADAYEVHQQQTTDVGWAYVLTLIKAVYYYYY